MLRQLCLVAGLVVLGCLAGCGEPKTLGFDDRPVTAAQLEAQGQERLDAAEKWAEQELAGHEAAIAKVQKEIDATRRTISSRVSAGVADIERQWQSREQWAGLIKSNAGLADLLIPGLGAIASGVAGVVLGRSGSRKREDKAWDESAAAKEAEVARRDAAWDAAKLEHKPDQTVATIAALLPLITPLIAAKAKDAA